MWQTNQPKGVRNWDVLQEESEFKRGIYGLVI